MDTLQVYWPGKFEGLVTINAQDFDATKHRRAEDGPPAPRKSDRDRRAEALKAMPAAEVKAIAEKLDIEHQNKDASIVAILAAEFPS